MKSGRPGKIMPDSATPSGASAECGRLEPDNRLPVTSTDDRVEDVEALSVVEDRAPGDGLRVKIRVAEAGIRRNADFRHPEDDVLLAGRTAPLARALK